MRLHVCLSEPLVSLDHVGAGHQTPSMCSPAPASLFQNVNQMVTFICILSTNVEETRGKAEISALTLPHMAPHLTSPHLGHGNK